MSSKSEIAEVQGVALAAYGLAMGVLRRLHEKDLLDQSEVSGILADILLSLEKSELVGQAEVHTARVLLSSLAGDLGVPMRKPQ